MRKIHIVLDSFKTHNPVKFYEYFNPQTARRLIEKFEFHFTPKHASWLNMTEIEFSVLFDKHSIGVFQTKKLYPTISWNKEYLFMSGVVLDRIVHSSHRVELSGPSMRKMKSSIKNSEY